MPAAPGCQGQYSQRHKLGEHHQHTGADDAGKGSAHLEVGLCMRPVGGLRDLLVAFPEKPGFLLFGGDPELLTLLRELLPELGDGVLFEMTGDRPEPERRNEVDNRRKGSHDHPELAVVRFEGGQDQGNRGDLDKQNSWQIPEHRSMVERNEPGDNRI
ncbi:MAG: hypothetical protein P8Y92_13620 [Halioglobus sp.]